jgi:uncharacterized protein involved in exopolysaccharide biosynthesis
MPPQTQTSSGMAMAAAELGSNPMVGKYASELLGVKGSGALFIGILQSRTIQDRLIDKYDLRRVYHEKYYYKARQILTKKTSIGEDRKSGIITISVTDRDRFRARDLAQEYEAQLARAVLDLNTSSAHQERLFLEERLAAVKADLDESSRQLSEYSSKNSTMDVKEQAKSTLLAAETVHGQLIAGEAELESLRQVYGEGNTRIKSSEARVAKIRSEMEKETGNGDSAKNGDLPSLRNLPVLAVKYGDLYRRQQAAEKLYELLAAQYEMVKIDEVKETPPVRVLDAAEVPEKPSSTPRILFVLAGVIISTFGAIALALMQEVTSATGNESAWDAFFGGGVGSWLHQSLQGTQDTRK